MVPFPFSDLSRSKRRPALVVATLDGNDVILCQITSRHIHDHYAISVTNEDFAYGTLNKPSNIRPNRLFTADRDLILYRAGRISDQTMTSIVEQIVAIIRTA